MRIEKQGNRRARLVNALLEARERMIGALLIGNNVANIAASTIATGMLLAWFGDVGVVYATDRHERHGHRVRGNAAQDRGDQRAGPDRAARGAADRLAGARSSARS